MFQAKKTASSRSAEFRHGAWFVVILALSVGCSAKRPETSSKATTKDDAAKPHAVSSSAAESQVAVARPQLAPPTKDAPKTLASKEQAGPQSHTAFFRAEVTPAKMPKVAFTKHEEGLCKVKVGDTMPAISLPKVGGSGTAQLSDSLGKKATVVVLWKGDRRMALEQLADLGPDVDATFGKEGVKVVGIAVNETAAGAAETLKKAEATFPNLLDADGKAFAQIGSERLPRTYLLDPEGKIVWFDIEYSQATRRELHEALRALTGASGAKQE
jgi:peroxiredoxin